MIQFDAGAPGGMARFNYTAPQPPSSAVRHNDGRVFARQRTAYLEESARMARRTPRTRPGTVQGQRTDPRRSLPSSPYTEWRKVTGADGRRILQRMTTEAARQWEAAARAGRTPRIVAWEDDHFPERSAVNTARLPQQTITSVR